MDTHRGPHVMINQPNICLFPINPMQTKEISSVFQEKILQPRIFDFVEVFKD